jgi:Mg2+ and Co2+ transporter CorA
MKIFSYIFFIVSTIIVGFNVTKLNFDNLLEGDSLIALICIVGVLCAIVILLIFRLSKSIEQKLKNQ